MFIQSLLKKSPFASFSAIFYLSWLFNLILFIMILIKFIYLLISYLLSGNCFIYGDTLLIEHLCMLLLKSMLTFVACLLKMQQSLSFFSLKHIRKCIYLNIKSFEWFINVIIIFIFLISNLIFTFNSLICFSFYILYYEF